MNFVFPIIYFFCIYALLVRDSRLKVLGLSLLLLLLWMIMGWSNTADMYIYEYHWYERAATYTPLDLLFNWDFKDRGYALLNCIFAYAGGSFAVFRVMLAFIYILAVVYFTRKVTKSTLLVMSLYVIWPFVMDTIQMRTTLVHILLFISLYIFARQEKYFYVKSILIVCLASTIHILALVYLPFFMFFKIYKYRYVSKAIWLISLFMPFYVDFFAGRVESFINYYIYANASGDITTKSFSGYTLAISSVSKYVYWIVINGIMATTLFIKKYWQDYCKVDWKNKFHERYIELAYAFSLYLALFLPLYALSGAEVARIPRCFCLTFIVIIVSFIETNKKNGVVNIILLASTVVILGLFGTVVIYYYPTDPSIINPSATQIFLENHLLESW